MGCDTGCVISEHGAVFVKNSDRWPNEPHYIERLPSQTHSLPSLVRCTHIAIPQVSTTYAVLLCHPGSQWGAEMGSNEKGLCVGNEALFSISVPAPKSVGLTGMDMVRLVLERSATPDEGLHVLTNLLEQYGQHADHSYHDDGEPPRYYQNGFFILNHSGGWHVETFAHEYVALRLIHGVSTISNIMSIGMNAEYQSMGIIDLARRMNRFTGNDSEFHFAHTFSDTLFTYFGCGKQRRQRLADSLERNVLSHLHHEEWADVAHNSIAALRDHGLRGHEQDPTQGFFGHDVCMHAGSGPIRISNTAGSMISLLPTSGSAVHLVTGTSSPCLSLFKPVFLDRETFHLPLCVGPPPAQKANCASLWWKGERLFRTVYRDYQKRKDVICGDRNEIEKSIIDITVKELTSNLYEQRAFQRESLCSQSFQIGMMWLDYWYSCSQQLVHQIGRQSHHFLISGWDFRNRRAFGEDGLIDQHFDVKRAFYLMLFLFLLSCVFNAISNVVATVLMGFYLLLTVFAIRVPMPPDMVMIPTPPRDLRNLLDE
jgi:secernin